MLAVSSLLMMTDNYCITLKKRSVPLKSSSTESFLTPFSLLQSFPLLTRLPNGLYHYF